MMPDDDLDVDCAIGRVEVESYDDGWAWRKVVRRWGTGGAIRYDPLVYLEKVLP